MSTTVTYQNVTLHDVKTLVFEQRLEYVAGESDPRERTRLHVEGWLHQADHPEAWIETPGQVGPPAEAFRAVTRRLLEPGGALRYLIGDATVLAAEAGGDLGGGPRPLRCAVTQVIGTQALRVEFEIETVRRRGVGPRESPWTHRWRRTLRLDENLRGSVLVEGTVESPSPLDPGSVAGLLFPPAPPGFFRRELRWQATGDGRRLDYWLEDREERTLPPPPATTWTCDHEERLTEEGAEVELRLELAGPTEAPIARLIAAAIGVIEARLGDLRQLLLREASIGEQVHDGRVRARVRGRRMLENASWATAVARLGSRLPHVLPRPAEPAEFAALKAPLLDALAAATQSAGTAPAQFPWFDPANPEWTGAYTLRREEETTETSSGRYVVPVASVSGAATKLVFGLHPPVSRRIVKLRSERLGEPPTAPSPRDWPADETLLETRVARRQRTPLPDGQTLHVLEAEYVLG